MKIHKAPASWNESEAMAQGDWEAKADWKRLDLTWRLKVDNLSTERMFAGSELQMDGAETENTQEVKLIVLPEGLARRFVL